MDDSSGLAWKRRLPATAATTTAATASATASATTATTATATTLGGVVDADGPAVELGAVEGIESLSSTVILDKSHESEAAGASRLAVGDDPGFVHVTAGLEVSL